MRLFGLEIRRLRKQTPVLSTPDGRGGWFPLIRESFSGAWQRGIEQRPENVLTYYAVYACVSLIASDIGKLELRLMQETSDGIFTETASPAFSPVLRKPNRYQTRIQFLEQWMTSKLIHGNTYVLKQRDARGLVIALYVLDPQRVRPLVAPDGSVYYELQQHDLAAVKGVIVPASEIVHDIMVPLYHPLCGVSPISACGLPAVQGLRIQTNSSNFFQNGAQPGGILTAPGMIAEEDRIVIQKTWDQEYSGDNAGKIAVLGNGLKYEAMSVNPVDAQLIEQLKLSAENVCSAYHVPAYKVGVAPPPAYNNIEALNVDYYTQCLQSLIEHVEVLLDEGLALPTGYSVELDLDTLLRMDTASRVKAAGDAIGSGAMSPNEARRRYFGLPPVVGGDSPFLQQQNYSLEALAKRDAQADPFAGQTPPPRLPEARKPESEERALVLADALSALSKAYDAA